MPTGGREGGRYMVENNPPRKTVIAKTTLSPRELDVAILARINLGRNAISSTLGISVNSVKTLLRRIEKKLGPDWCRNPNILWPEPEGTYVELQEAAEEKQLDEFEDGYYHRLERELRRQFKGRRTSLKLLINRNRRGKDILHVTSSQRLWLRPALKELEERKCIKLLVVDWNETFSPPWLPLVNRGRREIRAADYVTYNGRYVIEYIRNYVEHRLKDYILEVNSRLEEVRRATRDNKTIPDLKQLVSLALGG